MDGVAAIRSVLVADASLVTLIPDDCIIAGPLPVNAPLPAISLSSISKVDRNIPAPGATRFVRERVQVTVHARNYSSQKAILRAIRHAAADRIDATVDGIEGVTIHTESAGPDVLYEDASVWTGSQDFSLTYTEER